MVKWGNINYRIISLIKKIHFFYFYMKKETRCEGKPLDLWLLQVIRKTLGWKYRNNWESKKKKGIPLKFINTDSREGTYRFLFISALNTSELERYQVLLRLHWTVEQVCFFINDSLKSQIMSSFYEEWSSAMLQFDRHYLNLCYYALSNETL